MAFFSKFQYCSDVKRPIFGAGPHIYALTFPSHSTAINLSPSPVLITNSKCLIMPTLSVIIPNYNHAAFLRSRIDSVLSQTFDDIEVIILDDHSQDNSAEVINSYRGHPKITHIIFNNTNSGSTFKQWSKGIDVAKGKWIWIAESDDWSEKTFLETFLPAFDDSKGVSIAYCQSLVVNTEGKTLKTSNNERFEELIPGAEFVAKRLLKKNLIINASMCIFRKEYYHAVSDKYMHYKFIGDWLFWIEMAALGNVFISGKVLNYFRKHSADVTTTAYSSGLYFFEYFQLTEDLHDLKLLTSHEKQKMIEKNFSYYFFSNIPDKTVRKRLTKNYHSKLGLKYYSILANTYCKKLVARMVNMSVR